MENIEIFGLRSEEVDELRRNHSYYAWDEYNHNMALKRVVDQLIDGTFGRLSGNFDHIYDSLLRSNDEFFVLKDFSSYVDAWHRLENLYTRKDEWNRISLHNTATSGFFSSDRTIKQYAEEIWKL